jgi:Tfp pilus assembly protein PilV
MTVPRKDRAKSHISYGYLRPFAQKDEKFPKGEFRFKPQSSCDKQRTSSMSAAAESNQVWLSQLHRDSRHSCDEMPAD